MTTLLAYHNDPKIRAKFLRRVRAHQSADKIMQGYGYWKDGKGCAVGCTLHVNDSPHAQYPIQLGVPAPLAYLEDFFFERLPVEQAREWPARFLSAIRTGADLSRIYDLWTVWNLTDPEHGVLRHVSEKFPNVRRIVQQTADDAASGNRVNAARAAEAAEAAWAAWAAGAAEAAWAAWAARAARAAEAAWAARAAEAAWAAWAAWAAGAARAARAAEAAWAAGAAGAARAAEAAWAAGAAGAARAAYIKAASDKLIALLEAA